MGIVGRSVHFGREKKRIGRRGKKTEGNKKKEERRKRETNTRQVSAIQGRAPRTRGTKHSADRKKST